MINCDKNGCEKLRKQSGLTLRELARKASIAMSRLGGYESHKIELSVQEMWRVANALDCSMDELEPAFWNRLDVQ